MSHALTWADLLWSIPFVLVGSTLWLTLCLALFGERGKK